MFWVEIFLSTEHENIGTLGTSGKMEMTEMSNSGGFCFPILHVTKVDMGLPLWLVSVPKSLSQEDRCVSEPFFFPFCFVSGGSQQWSNWT